MDISKVIKNDPTVSSTEEIDNIKISIVRNQLRELHDLCQLKITCHTPDRDSSRAAYKSLMKSQKFTPASCRKVWVVEIYSNVSFEGIKDELERISQILRPNQCDIIDWTVKVAELG